MQKTLHRSQTNRVIAGVCGGIAEHLSVDPVLVRLIFILLTFATGLGPGILIYIIAWAIIPESPLITPSTSTQAPPPAPAPEPTPEPVSPEA
jgi:phage shock protein C